MAHFFNKLISFQANRGLNMPEHNTYINRVSLILASSSARRQALLRSCRVNFEVMTPDIEEKPKDHETPQEYCARNAREKSLAVAKKVSNTEKSSSLILSADTIVFLNNSILEKPQSREEAYEMLSNLSGSTHNAYTGYSFFRGMKELVTRVIESTVTFRKLSEHEIQTYISTDEPYDKAGGYGIQGGACGFIESVEGSFTNVMGLPLSQVITDLNQFDS